MKYFALSEGFNRAVPRLAVGPANEQVWRDAVRGKTVPLLEARQYMGGSQWKDFFGTGFAGTPIMSERVRGLLQEDGVTGWKPYPVRVFDMAGKEIPGYYGLGVTGRCGGRFGFDRRESALIYKASANGKPMPWFQSLHFAVSSWDGSDIFMDQEGSSWILVTDKVAKLFKRGKVSNCDLQDIESVELLAMDSEIIKES